jgi:hypothetical protein
VVRIGAVSTSYEWLKTLKGRHRSGDTGADGLIILKLIFKKFDVKAWAGIKIVQVTIQWGAFANRRVSYRQETFNKLKNFGSSRNTLRTKDFVIYHALLY